MNTKQMMDWLMSPERAKLHFEYERARHEALVAAFEKDYERRYGKPKPKKKNPAGER